MKEIYIEEIKLNGVPVAIRILKQSFIGRNFGDGSNRFSYNNFVLVSENFPEVMTNEVAKMSFCHSMGLWVRGTISAKDNNIIRIPTNIEWLLALRGAVKEYNKINYSEYVDPGGIKITVDVLK